jgi:hypothetical protein
MALAFVTDQYRRSEIKLSHAVLEGIDAVRKVYTYP